MELYEIKEFESKSVHQEHEHDDDPRGWYGDWYQHTSKSKWIYLFGIIPIWRISLECSAEFYCKEEEIGNEK